MALFLFQNKKGHMVASLSGSMDLRGLFASVLLSSPPLSGEEFYVLNIITISGFCRTLNVIFIGYTLQEVKVFIHLSDGFSTQSK
jgi:hypothetical protein